MEQLEQIREQLKGGFLWHFECISKEGVVKWKEKVHNLLPSAAIDYIIGAAFANTSQITVWYVGLSETAYAPTANDTLATVLDSGSGPVEETTKYGGGVNRITMQPDTVSNGLFSDAGTGGGTPAEFVFTASANIKYCFMASSQAINSTAGLMASSVALPSPRDVESGDTLKVVSGCQLTAA